MGSLNKILLIGNVGRDPEVRLSKNGDSMATFSLATSYGYKSGEGERDQQTEWHRIVMWRKLAEQAEKFVKKGRKLYVEGRVQTRTYDTPAGEKKSITEVIADRMEFLDRPGDGEDSTGSSAPSYSARPASTATASRGRASGGTAAPIQDMDDPFAFEDLRS